MENRLKEIAGNLKRDVKDLLNESASIVTGVFKKGFCTANGATKRWKTFTQGLSDAAKALMAPLSFTPVVPPNQEPFVTVRESTHEELPVGAFMTLSEAERRIEELNLLCWDSDAPSQDVLIAIDYRMDGVQDRYCLPLQIGHGCSTLLGQMQHHIQSALNQPDLATQDFYKAPPGLDELLHEHFGPQLQEDLEKLGGRVLDYFQQHGTISCLEQQFEVQAKAMPEKEKKQFLESAKKAVIQLRRAVNTGQAVGYTQEWAVPAHETSSPTLESPSQQQSVKVRLEKIKKSQAKGPAVKHKGRSGPQR